MTIRRAYLRDASWHRNPNTSAPKRLHLEHATIEGMAACNSRAVVLIMEHPFDADEPRNAPSLCLRCFADRGHHA